MRILLNNLKVKFNIGDLWDSKNTDDAMLDVDFMYHVAVLKQAPSCEFYPREAVKTNVLGTENELTSAIQHNVKKVSAFPPTKLFIP